MREGPLGVRSWPARDWAGFDSRSEWPQPGMDDQDPEPSATRCGVTQQGNVGCGDPRPTGTWSEVGYRTDDRSAQRRGYPAAAAGRAVHPGDGATVPVAPGPGPPRAARQSRGPEARRVPPGESGAGTGHLPGHGATLAASRLADGATVRPWPSRDLGRQLRAATAPGAERSAAELVHQDTPGRMEQAEGTTGAAGWRWPGSPGAEAPHRAPGGHYG